MNIDAKRALIKVLRLLQAERNQREREYLEELLYYDYTPENIKDPQDAFAIGSKEGVYRGLDIAIEIVQAVLRGRI